MPDRDKRDLEAILSLGSNSRTPMPDRAVVAKGEKHVSERALPDELVSGSLGYPVRFEIDSIHPVLSGASIRVRLRNEQDAMNLIRATTHPEWVGPRSENQHIADDDNFCDEVIKAVRHWVATFPLFLVNSDA